MEGNDGRPGLVHRIDKDTSGLLVIAKTEKAMTGLAKQFFDHSIERTYYALIWGEPKEDKRTIDVLQAHPKCKFEIANCEMETCQRNGKQIFRRR